eukprot:1182782-Prorocentrum_minimum.AAC.1
MNTSDRSINGWMAIAAKMNITEAQKEISLIVHRKFCKHMGGAPHGVKSSPQEAISPRKSSIVPPLSHRGVPEPQGPRSSLLFSIFPVFSLAPYFYSPSRP